MKRRTLINYTPEQKAIIWDRYEQGDSLHDIARMFDRFHSSVMHTIYETGGYLYSVARQLNERPRKTPDYESPADLFKQCVASIG